MKEQKEYVEELLNLIKENPELEIIPLVDGNICDDFCGYFTAKWSKAYVDKYFIDDERIYFIDDCDELIEREIDRLFPENDDYDEEMEKEAEKAVDAYDWKKAIFVHIRPR